MGVVYIRALFAGHSFVADSTSADLIRPFLFHVGFPPWHLEAFLRVRVDQKKIDFQKYANKSC